MKKQILYSISILAIGIGVGLFLNQGESSVKQEITGPEKANKIDQAKVSTSSNSIKETAIAAPKVLIQEVPEQESVSQNNINDYWVKPEEVTSTTTSIVDSNESSYVVVSHPIETTMTKSYMIKLPPKEYVTTSSGYEYETGGRAVDGGPINPHWTMGSNGLWQNPNVDPPSCSNRETTRLQ